MGQHSYSNMSLNRGIDEIVRQYPDIVRLLIYLSQQYSEKTTVRTSREHGAHYLLFSTLSVVMSVRQSCE